MRCLCPQEVEEDVIFLCYLKVHHTAESNLTVILASQLAFDTTVFRRGIIDVARNASAFRILGIREKAHLIPVIEPSEWERDSLLNLYWTIVRKYQAAATAARKQC